MLRFALAVFAPLQLLTHLSAQVPGSWVALNLTPRPFARERHAMAFDSARSESVLFGGFNGAYMNDTWVLGPTGWTQRTPATSPPARADHAMAFDPVRQRTVLLGGTNGSPLTDIWEWDGLTWTQRATGVTGLADGGSATFDPLLSGVFYNRDAVNLLWNGTAANTLTVAQPTGASNCPMVFHAAAGGALRRVGQYTYRFSLPQGWVDYGFDQAFQVTRYAIASDPVRNRVFVQGGNGSVGSGSGLGIGHSWQWMGSYVWSEISGPLPRRDSHAMVFDFGRDTFVMFGGHANGGSWTDTTFVWSEITTAAQYETYGAGCSGALAQPPRLRPNPLWNSAPLLGGQFFVLVDQVPVGSPVAGVIGLSDAVWSSLPLPLNLDSIGMPGCQLLAAADVVLALGVANSAGSANWVTAIPSTASLAGFEFFQQALAVVPGANAAGIVLGNGGHGIVGN
jgi:hypothetical protein